MDTRRCLRCHKLLRANAPRCSLCGYVFLQAPAGHSNKATDGSHHSATASFPSNAPASPHRAGHYSGLHPEDQPYQSSFMPILRPSAITRRLVEQESDEALQPITVSSVPSQLVHEMEPPPFVPESTLHEQITAPLPLPVYVADERQPSRRIVRILVVAGILSFLLASTILVQLVLFAGTGVLVHPAVKVVHTSSQQGQSTPPNLQLSASQIDFGAVSVHNTITLTNAGDQQIVWQAGVDSNRSWLVITPTFGTFSKLATATLTVNRSNLTPQTYTGYINFFQKGTNNALTLKVTMSVTSLAATATVSPPPTILTVSPTLLPAMVLTTKALIFNAIQGKNPTQQTFTLANPGNAPLNWAITGDANANTLLSISPKSGIVASGSSVPITVTPNVLNSTAGVINATLAIQGTSVKSQQVAVKITISNQALISVSPVNIVCKLSSITTNSTQSLNITNSGSATLNWTFSQSLPPWISVDIPGGTLPPGYIAFVNVACNNTGLPASKYPYTYTLVVSDTDAQTPVIPQNIQVTLTVT